MRVGKAKAKRDRAFTLVELLVVIAIIGVLVALLLPAVQAAREAARRMQCANNLKQLGLAILNYEGSQTQLPISVLHVDEVPGVEASGVSWMVLTLPYIEENALYSSIDYTGSVASGQGMLKLSNRPAIKTPVDAFFCPSDTSQGVIRSEDVWRVRAGVEFAVTNYAGVLGPHNLGNASLFGGASDCHNYASYKRKQCAGTFWRHSHMAPPKLKSFVDGLSNTIVVGEVLPEFDHFKYWALGNGTWASTHAPINFLPEPNEPYNNWTNQMSFRSRHPGGSQFAWGDGHVDFLTEDMDIDVYWAASTRAGEEAL